MSNNDVSTGSQRSILDHETTGRLMQSLARHLVEGGHYVSRANVVDKVQECLLPLMKLVIIVYDFSPSPRRDIIWERVEVRYNCVTHEFL